MRVSALGFGAMRLPRAGRDIDREAASALIEAAIAGGVNYFDTAYGYHDGESEKLLGTVLKQHRDKVFIATKMPPWNVNTADDFDRIFDDQRARLQTDCLDCYLLHSLDTVNWPKLRALNVIDWLERKRASGAIRHVGFSFHDNLETFRAILDAYDGWEFCQVQYNYLDIGSQAGTEGVKYAASKSLGVIVMEPLLGGILAEDLPAGAMKVLEEQAGGRGWSPAEWGLRWLWDQPEVNLVLSGMTTPAQLTENCRSASAALAGGFTEVDHEIVRRLRAEFEKLSPVPCTACRYCQPCPEGVEIHRIFGLYNRAFKFNRPDQARWGYSHLAAEHRADRCVECGQCEAKCPQKIAIVAKLKEAHRFLRGGRFGRALRRLRRLFRGLGFKTRR